MEILNKTIHVINYEQEKVYPREIPDTFDEYVRELIDHIMNNEAVREYKTQSQQTQVIANVKRIIAFKQIEIEKINANMLDTAQRLLAKEIVTQGRVERLGVHVQKGSLIQVVLFNPKTKKFSFLLAKVEHTDFVDDFDFSFKTGFSKDKKNIWKSCLIFCGGSAEDEISDAKIFTSTKAKYWSDDFLELIPAFTDEINTEKAFKSIDSTLGSMLKKDAPQDYMYLRNAMIVYFRRGDHIDYNDMISGILDSYSPENMNVSTLAKLKDNLLKLPESRHFDRQFSPIASLVKARIKKSFSLNVGIDLTINDAVDDIMNTISATKEDDGTKYIKIVTNNEDAYRYFKKLE